MKPQAAFVDVIFVKIAKNPTLENIESVFQKNHEVFVQYGLSESWISKIKDIIISMSNINIIYIDQDPTLFCGEFTEFELMMIEVFTGRYVTIRNSNQNYFYKNVDGKIVNVRGHICDIIAIRVTFGDMYAPILVSFDKAYTIKAHVHEFKQQLSEYKETVYYQLGEDFGCTPLPDQQPMLFFYEGDKDNLKLDYFDEVEHLSEDTWSSIKKLKGDVLVD